MTIDTGCVSNDSTGSTDISNHLHSLAVSWPFIRHAKVSGWASLTLPWSVALSLSSTPTPAVLVSASSHHFSQFKLT